MGVEVAATTSFQWSSRLVQHHSPSTSQSLVSAISSPLTKRRCGSAGTGALAFRYVHGLNRSALFGPPSTKLSRTRSCEHLNSRVRTLRRACSASLDAFSDEEFSKKIQELALRFQLLDDEKYSSNGVDSETEIVSDIAAASTCNGIGEESSDLVKNHTQFPNDSVEPPWDQIREIALPDWSGREDIIPASIERKANSVDLPLSLRIIKRKMQWQEGFREAGESAYCSVKKAFSSMVFIIRELHRYTLQMREQLFTEDLQGILVRVQKEMHASFVWLFQQVFSHTPALMVSIMILLANFTVYSMGSSYAVAAASPPLGATESVSAVEIQDYNNHKFDSSSLKTFSVSSSGGKSTSIGGNNGGGGGKVRPVGSGTEGDGWLDRSNQFRMIVPDGGSQLSSLGTSREAESVSGEVARARAEESSLWNSIVEEASKVRAESLDQETIQRLVSPITAKIEEEDYADYFRTELLYQTGLSQDPANPLLLANFAQFLYLVARDYDRAEEYFKRAVKVEPADAEAFSKYANFLWRVRNELWRAEETFLEAISADPTNSHYAANYAHFLWNTGGEDTCFPLSSPDNDNAHEI